MTIMIFEIMKRQNFDIQLPHSILITIILPSIKSELLVKSLILYLKLASYIPTDTRFSQLKAERFVRM